MVSFERVGGTGDHSVTRDSIDYLTKLTELVISRILVDSSRSSEILVPESGCFD